MEAQGRFSLPMDRRNAQRAKLFFAAYPSAVVVTHPETPEYLGVASPRICRFCGKARPEVKFKSAAHVIPQFMVNKNVLSYFECDTCNARFSKYEASFARFIGASRTISQLKGQKNKIPKFEDSARGLEFKMGEHSLQLIVNQAREGYTVDLEKKEITFSTVRHAYVPIHILKVLVKIGLSLLDESEVPDYELARQFVLSDAHDAAFARHPMLHLYFYSLPGPPWYSPPAAHLYVLDAASTEPFPSRQLVLYYGNYCFQLALPFGVADKARLLGRTMELPRFPLLLNHELLRQFGEYQEFEGDFTSAERRVNEPHEITCSFQQYTRVDPDESEEDTLRKHGYWPEES